jgi:hypothetical protein
MKLIVSGSHQRRFVKEMGQQSFVLLEQLTKGFLWFGLC